MELMLVGLAVIVVVVGGVIWYRRSQAKKEESSVQETPARPRHDTAQVLRDRLQDLVLLNTLVRSRALPRDVTEVAERIIDKLRKLLVSANEEYPSADFTYNLNESAREYLPRLFRQYADLNPAQRETRKEDLFVALQGIEAGIDEGQKLVDSHNDRELTVEANFLGSRFPVFETPTQ